MASHHDIQRVPTVDTQAGDLEIGVTDAIQKHFSRQVVSRKAVTQRKLDFERRRPRWLRECMAEATGVFFYVYPGIAATTSLLLAANSAEPGVAAIAPAFGNFLTIGLAYAIGIAFAIILCAPTSGGHFNPAVTICLAYWQGFPWRKVPYFIFSQIFGSFMAGMLLMGQYHVQINEFAAASQAKGLGYVYQTGPAACLVTIPQAVQTNLGYLVLIEWFVDSFIGLIIWASLDPANPFVSPQTAPWTIGLAYGNMVWGFGANSISTNLARDLGCRIVAAIFFGGEVFTYHHYSWISILINVPATWFATCYYEFLMRDSLQKLGKGAAVHEEGHHGLMRHITREGIMPGDEGLDSTEPGTMNASEKGEKVMFRA